MNKVKYINTISKKILLLTKKLIITKDPQEQLVIKTDIASLRMQLFDHSIISLDIKDNIKHNCAIIDIYHVLIPTIYTYLRELNFVTEHINEPQEISLSEKNIIKHAENFFLHIGGPFYQKFMQVYYKLPSNHYFNNKDMVQMTYLSSLGEIYSSSSTNYYLRDLSNFIHEISHGIEILLNPEREEKSEYNPYQEVVAIFFELLSFDYIEKYFLHYDSKKDLVINRLQELHNMSDSSLFLADLNYDGFDRINKPTLHLIKELAHLYNCSIPKIFFYLTKDFLEPTTYACSHLIAIEFYELYQKNKKEALSLLLEFINLEKHTKKNITEFFQKVNITPLNSIEEHLTKIKELK